MEDKSWAEITSLDDLKELREQFLPANSGLVGS